jgi:hypothetical protein
LEEFDEFLKTLLHTNHDEIVRFLQLKSKFDDMIDLNLCDPKDKFEEMYSFGHYNSRDKLEGFEKSTSSSLTSNYPMMQSPRGFCLLVNNYFTIGTYKEMQRFRYIFYQLHFDIIMRKNLKNDQLIDEIKKISKSRDLEIHDAFVLMVISKGNDDKEIFDVDNEPLHVSSLIELLCDEKCPSLKNKPRMFFFNCLNTGNNQIIEKHLIREMFIELFLSK